MKRIAEWFRRFTHDRLGWGYPDASIGFDGCSATSTCVRCGKRLLQDSQGNWFHTTQEGEVTPVSPAHPSPPVAEVTPDGARLDAIEENGWDVRDVSVATPVGHPAAPTGDVTVIYDVTEWHKGERRVVASGGTVREALDNAIAAREAR